MLSFDLILPQLCDKGGLSPEKDIKRGAQKDYHDLSYKATEEVVKQIFKPGFV